MSAGGKGSPGDGHRILELFSGIGGMRYAAQEWAARQEGGRSVEVVQACDISQLANSVYALNHGHAPSVRSIEHHSAADLDALGADTWLMSPPCQPYTSQGLQQDDQDPRARALLHLIKVLPSMERRPLRILLENVKNFEVSKSHRLWVGVLEECGYVLQQFLLTPPQLGIPNERLRYYCLARLGSPGDGWEAPTESTIQEQLPPSLAHALPWLPSPPVPRHHVTYPRAGDDGEGGGEGGHKEAGGGGEEGGGGHKEAGGGDDQGVGGGGRRAYVDFNVSRAAAYAHCRPIETYLEAHTPESLAAFSVKDKDLTKYKGYVFDIVTGGSRRCSCFTKSYCKYVRGTGSLLSGNFYGADGRCLLDLSDAFKHQELALMQSLQLRYFTPREVANMLGFPQDTFRFPDDYRPLMCYRLLGNSLCVTVVSVLLEILLAA